MAGVRGHRTRTEQLEAGASSRLLARLMREVEEAIQRAGGGTIGEPEGSHADPLRARDSRVQPLVLLLASECLGGATARSVSLAAVVELVHAAVLAHDAVRDDGFEAVAHSDGRTKRKNQTSVLRGDHLLAAAIGALATGGNMSFLSDLMRAFAEMCEGQVRLLQARGSFLETEGYLDALRMRVGSLTSFSARAGGLSARGPAECVDALGAFGERFGVASHLTGEILDLVGDSQGAVDRVLARDRWCPLPVALTAQAGERERASVQAILARGGLLPEDLVEVRQLAEASGAVARCWGIVDDWLARALSHLTAIGDSPAKELLVQTAVDLCGGRR